MSSAEKNILVLAPPCYQPSLQNFAGKYRLLSGSFSGHILCRTLPEFVGSSYGRFQLHVLALPRRNGLIEKLLYIYGFVSAGIRLERAGRFDLIISHDPLTLGIAGALLKLITGTKMIVEVNGHLLEAGFLGDLTYGKKIKRMMVKSICRCVLSYADGVKCINSKLVEEVRALCTNVRTYCFHDYVPINEFLPSSADKKFIFFAGYPFYLKGVDLLIAAFGKLYDEFPDYRLIIMGHNVDMDKYHKIAALYDRIEFHKPVNHNEIVSYFRDCSLFVLPSRSEAMGRVLIEAMASAKAVVASRIGGIPEVVEDGVTGLLFESGNADDLAAKLRVVLGDPALRASLGRAGRARALNYFSEEIYLDSFIRKVDEVLAGPLTS